ncbi:MAG: hypothetical protein ACTSV5_09785 [Promethearchaeota archaeon]
MNDIEKKQSIRSSEPEFKVNYKTLLWCVAGFIISWFNMVIIQDSPRSVEVLAFLSIILTTFIPAIIISLKDRYWGYGYMIGFSMAGIFFMMIMDPFIGGYTFVTALFIFIIMLLIFWKTWRTLSSIKTNLQNE